MTGRPVYWCYEHNAYHDDGYHSRNPQPDDTVEIPVICGDCALQEVCCRDDA